MPGVVPSGAYVVSSGVLELLIDGEPTGARYTKGAFLGEFFRYGEGIEAPEESESESECEAENGSEECESGEGACV